MALINCTECSKEISELAAACPGCGAPVLKANSAPATENKKTSKSTWAVLAAIIFGIFLYTQSRDYKEQSLPPLPVEVGFRNALTGPGLVLQVKNTSDKAIVTLVTLKSPTMQQEKSFRLDIPAQGITEVGHKEGWVLAHGDTLKIFNEQFQSWSGNIP